MTQRSCSEPCFSDGLGWATGGVECGVASSVPCSRSNSDHMSAGVPVAVGEYGMRDVLWTLSVTTIIFNIFIAWAK